MPNATRTFFSRLSAAFAEREVVFARAALVAVSFDRDRHVRIALQPLGLPLQDLLRFRRNVGAVEGEKHAVTGTRLQILLRSRQSASRANAARCPRPGPPGPPGPPGAVSGALLQAASKSTSPPKMPIVLVHI